ncbi:helix-turn-helix transcriptional regulator [Paenibacillus sp. FSL H8-0034]|uniref:helix-turn-helix transcriptional regulator n=1 Tax=Paenibacillus sp. FSL H8-0034 TaxID=2954671 RepID=UPI0030FC6224
MFKSKTFVRILVTITLTLIILITVFSRLLFVQFEKAGLESTNEFNRKMLSELTFNIDYMNQLVKNFAVNQYFDPGNVQLMFYRNTEFFDVVRTVNRFHESISSNLMIHSAVLYNNYQQEFYSTSAGIGIEIDSELPDMINNGMDIPPLTPIPRVLRDASSSTPLFTYFMFDEKNSKGLMNGALILHVKMDWLRRNLQKFMNPDSNFIIFDKHNQIILDARERYHTFDPLREEYARLLKEPENGDSSIMNIGDEKRVITYLTIPGTDAWTLISDEPYDAVFQSMLKLKNQIVQYTILFMVAAVIIASLLSRMIYAPFGRLVQRVKSQMKEQGQLSYRNDPDYLASIFDTSLHRFQEYKMSTQELVKENVLKSILLENQEKQGSTLGELFKEVSDFFAVDREYLLVIFKIDQSHIFQKLEASESQFIKFSVMNIAGDVLQDFASFEKATMENGEFIYLFGMDEPFIPEQERLLKEKLATIQAVVHRVSKLVTISAMISEPCKGAGDLQQLYKATLHLHHYRLRYGTSCILDQATVASDWPVESFTYPEEWEKELIDALKQGKASTASACYENFIQAASRMDDRAFMLSAVRLAFSIGNLVDEWNRNRMDKIPIHIHEVYSDILQLDTLEQFSGQFKALFEAILDSQKQDTDSKHHTIIRVVMDYIQLHIHEEELTLKMIASEFKMSQGSLGQIFREATSKSIAKYINDLRLEEVLYLLKTTEWSIREISQKVGFTNETHFYKLFKKELGFTPSEFRMNITLLDKMKSHT